MLEPLTPIIIEGSALGGQEGIVIGFVDKITGKIPVMLLHDRFLGIDKDIYILPDYIKKL